MNLLLTKKVTMKEISSGVICKSLMTFLMVAFVQSVLWAQDNGSGSAATSGSSVSVTTESTQWYAAPWVWIVGAVVLILLLVALLPRRGSNAAATTTRTERVTVTKSSDSDDF
jgi:hypothetical protein